MRPRCAIASRLTVALILACAVSLLAGCSKSPKPPPVDIAVRKSIVGVGRVIQIRNRSAHHLYNVKVVLRDLEKLTSGSVRATSHLRPYTAVEVGWLQFQGWVPQRGQTIEVYCDDHLLPKIAVVP